MFVFTDENAILQAAATLAGNLLIVRQAPAKKPPGAKSAAVALKAVLAAMEEAGLIREAPGT